LHYSSGVSSRQHLADRAADAIRAELGPFWRNDVAAEAVVDALLPLITEPKQMAGVPEGSVVLVETATPHDVRGSVAFLWWRGGKLHGSLEAKTGGIDPVWVIDKYGPMTLVWMP
jgi:hypothetical protein